VSDGVKSKFSTGVFQFGLVILALTGCAGNEIGSGLVTQIEATGGSNVRLESVIEGDWSHFLVVCPYDPDVNERLGFTWSGAPDTASSDSSQLLVFVKGGTVVASTRVLLTEVNLCTRVWELQPASTALDFNKDATGTWVVTSER
jgi:hypothetical protein